MHKCLRENRAKLSERCRAEEVQLAILESSNRELMPQLAEACNTACADTLSLSLSAECRGQPRAQVPAREQGQAQRALPRGGGAAGHPGVQQHGADAPAGQGLQG